MPTYKLVMLGDSGVGKTAFLKRHLTGEFEWNHVPTKEVETHQLEFDTSAGKVTFEVLDFPGARDAVEALEDHLKGSHCAIIMFDITSRITYRNVPGWYDMINKVCPDIPTSLVGNKIDNRARKVKHGMVKFPQTAKRMLHYDVSVRKGLDLSSPFGWIAGHLTHTSFIKVGSKFDIDKPAPVRRMIEPNMSELDVGEARKRIRSRARVAIESSEAADKTWTSWLQSWFVWLREMTTVL